MPNRIRRLVCENIVVNSSVSSLIFSCSGDVCSSLKLRPTKCFCWSSFSEACRVLILKKHIHIKMETNATTESSRNWSRRGRSPTKAVSDWFRLPMRPPPHALHQAIWDESYRLKFVLGIFLWHFDFVIYHMLIRYVTPATQSSSWNSLPNVK